MTKIYRKTATPAASSAENRFLASNTAMVFMNQAFKILDSHIFE